jgi:O-antigen/teichoic acid export membrane protein
LKEKFVFSLITRLSSNILFLFASYILLLKLDISSIGLWVFLNTGINLGFLFINIGFDSIHTQYSGKENISDYIGTFFMIKVVILIINIIITLGLLAILQIQSIEFFGFSLLLLFSKIFFCIGNIFIVNLRIKIKIFKAEIPNFLVITGNSLSIIFLALNISHISDPILYLSVSNLIFYTFFVIIIIFLSKNEIKINKPNKLLARVYIKDAKPLIFSSIVSVIATYLGNLILYYSFGGVSLGYFSSVNTYLIPVLLLISGSITTIYLTLFSQDFEREDINSIKSTLYIIENYSSVLFLSIIIIILLNGELIFSIFLPTFVEAVPILYIMIFMPYFMGISQPYSWLLIAGKKQKINARVNSFVYILIIFLMLYFIPQDFFFFQTVGLGVIGYALAQTIPWILWAILCRYYIYKTLDIKYQKTMILQFFLALLTIIVSIFIKNILNSIFTENQILLLILSSIIAMGMFIGFLIIFKELKREDLSFFIEIMKLKSYTESVKKEFRS